MSRLGKLWRHVFHSFTLSCAYFFQVILDACICFSLELVCQIKLENDMEVNLRPYWLEWHYIKL